MAISRLTGQDARNTSATSSVSVSYPGATTSGNLLIASVWQNKNNANTLSITGWTQAIMKTSALGAFGVAIFYKLSAGTETSITASSSAVATSMKLHIYEYTGNANPIVVDITNSAINSSVSSASSASVTTTNASDLIFVAFGDGANITALSITAPFNIRQQDATNIRLFDADQIVSSTGTYSASASWTTSTNEADVTAAFEASSGSSVSITQVAANLTASGGTQSVVSVSSASIAQVAANLTATGGTQGAALIFGTTSSAGLTIGGLNEIAGTKYTLPSGGMVTKLSLYTPNSGNAIGAIYSDVAGVPTSLLVSDSNTPTAMTAGQFNDIDIPDTFLAAGDYWLVFMTSASNMRGFKTGGTNQAAFNLSTTYNTTWPSSFPTPSFQNNDYVAYATYIPGSSVSIAQVTATVTATGGTQTIATVNDVAIAQVHGTLTATGGTQLAETNGIVPQSAANLTITGGTQSVATVNIVSISQVAATVTATGGSQGIQDVQDVQIAQSAATLTATGGTQSIATVNDVSLSQSAATLTATGGIQVITTGSIVNAVITQIAASLTASGGTQVVASIQDVSLTQSAANLTATGGVQSISTVNFVSINQIGANVTATGGAPTIATVNNVSIAQSAATLTVNGGTQSLTAMVDAAIAQQAANLLATGGTQTVSAFSGTVNASVTQAGASLTATGGRQIISINSSPLPPHKTPNPIFLTDGRMAVRISSTVYMPL